jgi:hypothetical protein
MLIISIFPLCLILLCSPIFQQFPFGRSINHPLFGKYMLGQSIRHIYFCIGLFSCVVMFYRVFFPFYFPLPFWMKFTSLVWPLLFILFLTILFHSWSLWGLWSNLTSVLLGHFLVCLLVSFLYWFLMLVGWHQDFGCPILVCFFLFPTKCIKRRFLPYM